MPHYTQSECKSRRTLSIYIMLPLFLTPLLLPEREREHRERCCSIKTVITCLQQVFVSTKDNLWHFIWDLGMRGCVSCGKLL